jgi:hypothetical protein
MKKLLVELLASLLFAVIALVILAEWLAGCGESYVDSDGKRHYYECLVVPYEPEEEGDDE